MFGPRPPSRFYALHASMMAILPLAVLLQRRRNRRRNLRMAILAMAQYGAAPIVYPAIRITVHTWHPRACHLTTRFYPHELIEIYTAGGFPETIRLENRSREDGLTALAMYCARLATPTRYFDLAHIFGREMSVIGRICRWVQSWIVMSWGHLLRWSTERLPPARLEAFAQALQDVNGCPMDNCCGFIDGTIWRISRPGENQRAFYNGWKRIHSLKYQAVVTPDGLTADLTEAYVGSRHDQAILGFSGLEAVLETDAKGFGGRQMMLYGDRGYAMSNVIMSPYPGARLEPAQAEFNRLMCTSRVQVEHEFSSLRNQERMTQYEDNLRFYVQELNELYWAAVLLKNLLRCCAISRGSPIGILAPPNITEYLSFPAPPQVEELAERLAEPEALQEYNFVL